MIKKQRAEKDIFIENFKLLCHLSSTTQIDLTEEFKEYQREYIRYRNKLFELKQFKLKKSGDITKNAKYEKYSIQLINAQLGMIRQLDLFIGLKNCTRIYEEIIKKEESLRQLLIDPCSTKQTINDFLLFHNVKIDLEELEQILQISQPFVICKDVLEWKSIWQILKEEVSRGLNKDEDINFIDKLQKEWEKAVILERKYAAIIQVESYDNLEETSEKKAIVQLMLFKLQLFFEGRGNINITYNIFEKCQGKIDVEALERTRGIITAKREPLVDPARLAIFYKYIVKYGRAEQIKQLYSIEPDSCLIAEGQKMHKYQAGWVVTEIEIANHFNLPQKKPSIFFFNCRRQYKLSWHFSFFSLVFQSSFNNLSNTHEQLVNIIRFDLNDFTKVLKKAERKFVNLEKLLARQYEFSNRAQIKWINKIKFLGFLGFLFKTSNNYLKCWQGVLIDKYHRILYQQQEILIGANKRFYGWLKTKDLRLLLGSEKQKIKALSENFKEQAIRLEILFETITKRKNIYNNGLSLELHETFHFRKTLNFKADIFNYYQQENELLLKNQASFEDNLKNKTKAIKTPIQRMPNSTKKSQTSKQETNKSIRKAKDEYAKALAEKKPLTTAKFDLLVANDPFDVAKLMIRRLDLHDKMSKNIDEIFNSIEKHNVLTVEDKKYLLRILRYFYSLKYKPELLRIKRKIKKYELLLKGESRVLLKSLNLELKKLIMKNIDKEEPLDEEDSSSWFRRREQDACELTDDNLRIIF